MSECELGECEIANTSIFIYTWNTQTISITADSADYITSVAELITQASTDLIAVCLQEDNIRESEFIQLLSGALEFTYSLISSEQMSGWGVTTYKALRDEWKYLPRGLRIAVYRKNTSRVQVQSFHAQLHPVPGVRDWITYGKGGLVYTLETSVGTFTFVNAHLPFDSSSLLPQNTRTNALIWQTTCLHDLCNFVHSTDNTRIIFLCGDLNFRMRCESASAMADILHCSNLTAVDYTALLKTDEELTIIRGYPQFTHLFEGVRNAGPQFLPTCKMKHGRVENCVALEYHGCKKDGLLHLQNSAEYKCGKSDQRVPSWCDRILYTTDKVTCIEYNRFDVGEMNNSDHAAVYGVYTVTSEK